jgi:hypothetical protein
LVAGMSRYHLFASVHFVAMFVNMLVAARAVSGDGWLFAISLMLIFFNAPLFLVNLQRSLRTNSSTKEQS